MPGRPNGKALHRGRVGVENRFHIGTPMHRMWDLRQEMSFRSNQHHQPPNKSRVPGHSSILGEQFQAPPPAHAPTRASAGSGRNKWYRQKYRLKDTEWEAET